MKIEIELSDDDFNLLILALGLATGIASRNGNAPLVRRILRLADIVNMNNLDWRPHSVDESTIPEGL